MPAWARDLYSKELEGFAPSRLNPAAASLADAKTIAERIGGPDATTRIGGFGLERTTRGEVVGESAGHWVQRARDKQFVAHFKGSVTGSVKLHHTYEISYPQKGRAGAAELIPPHAAVAGALS